MIYSSAQIQNQHQENVSVQGIPLNPTVLTRFLAKIGNIYINFQLKIFIFLELKKVHGHVFVMNTGVGK